MAQVSDQTQLQAALAARDEMIQITSDFSINSQINILYPVTIESSNADTPYTLTKDASYFGYLFRVQNGGSLTLRNVILDGDKANHPEENQTNRSLVYVAGGTLNLQEGAVLQNNYAYLEGGGVYLNRNDSAPNTLSMSGSARITGCSSRSSGGGVMLAAGDAQDSFHISGASQIDGNRAANGGGIYCRGYVQDIPTMLSIDGEAQITNNQAESTGGGICFSGFRNGGSAGSVLTLSGNVLLSGNQAVSGGGIYFYASNTGDRLAITESASIAHNTASQSGGGCHIRANGVPADVTVNSASVTDNTAGTGGGLYLLTDAGASVDFTGCVFTGNRAINGASGTGGGIWIKNQSESEGISVMLSDITAENNQASAHAGGMALYAGAGTFIFQMTGGMVSGNLASQEGGGFVISHDGAGILTFNQPVFTNNTAHGSGGGIYYAGAGEDISSTFTMSDTVISGNTADRSGGGLNLSTGSSILTALLDNCTISSNTAFNNSGGGIWVGGMDDTLTLSGTTAVTENSTHAGNGGGIYFNSDHGTLLLTGNVKISENKADAVSSDFGNHGGGICLVPGILTIQENAEISSNSAGKYGGGISAAENSQIIMQGGSLQQNTSGQFGGGIWNHGGSTTTLIDGSIADNEAVLGNDIYSDSGLYMEGLRELKNGVCIANAASVVKLSSALTGTSEIQLETSAYVTPNQNGTPIIVGEATAVYPQLTQTDANAFLKPLQGFEGWEIRLNENSTHILLAPVIYSIHYENLMGAYNPNPASYHITTPTIELLPLTGVFGYRFLGWFDDISGGNQVTSIPQGSTGDITIYALWEKIAEAHTITFRGNDNCCPKACNIPAQMTVRNEQAVTLPTSVPPRSFYCFCQWNTDCCGKGTSYLPGDTIPSVSADLILYATWKRNPCGCPCKPVVRSERPVIISVTAADTRITGTGIPGAFINVTLPDGAQLQTTVNRDGQWAVTLPDGTTLKAGQTIYANQTEQDKAVSENASFLVQASPAAGRM